MVRHLSNSCDTEAGKFGNFNMFKLLTYPLLFYFQDVEDSRENFYEGAFLSMLFKKLQRLLDQVWCLKNRIAQWLEDPHIFSGWF